MYKKAAEAWQRISTKARGSSQFVREGRKAARAFLTKERLEKKIPCPSCQHPIANQDLSDHLFSRHDLSSCKFCKALVVRESLHWHIRKEHGERTFEKWSKQKESENKRHKKKVRSNEKWETGVITPSGELVKCTFCNQMVDESLLTMHAQRFCKQRAPSRR